MEENIKKHVSQIYYLAELNVQQIRLLDRNKTAVLIPGGVLEEHGPFLPCSTDTLGSERLTCKLAESIAQRPGWSVLIFPTIPLGYSAANWIGGRDSFPGTYTIGATTLRAVIMDLASELGEQGFRWIFYINQHIPPGEQKKAIHQACAYFNDVYGGKMIHLLGFIDLSIYEDILTPEDQLAAGIDVHAGALETSWMLAFHSDLVDPGYKQAVPQTGENWGYIGQVASAPDWPGYVGAPALAKGSYGRALAEKINTAVIPIALRILDGENIEAPGYDDLTPLQDQGWAGRRQQEWLEKNGLK